jgi:hypothetical protein
MKTWLAIMLFASASFVAMAQNEDDESEYDENYEFPETKLSRANISIGLGLGLDYGGIGGKLMFVPTPRLGIFGSIGYNFVGAGYNGGVVVRLSPTSKVCPYITGMYGYNAVLVIEGGIGDDVGKTYYGPSLGGGIELHRRDKSNFWNFGLTIPIRSQQYRDDIDALRNNPNYELTEPLLPFTISVGYHFAL